MFSYGGNGFILLYNTIKLPLQNKTLFNAEQKKKIEKNSTFWNSYF